MASLQCNHCGYGIHYHDEPDGTEHFAIPLSTWEWYRSSGKSIIRAFLDGPQDFLTIWRCKECGCLHTFLAHDIRVVRAYVPCDYSVFNGTTEGIKYRVFDDCLFDAVAEVNLTVREYEQSKEYDPCCFAVINDSYIVLYDDKKLTHVTGCFQAIESDKRINATSS